MIVADQVRWFDPLGDCRACGKAAHGTLLGPRNESYGSYCTKCANARLKKAELERTNATSVEDDGEQSKSSPSFDLAWVRHLSSPDIHAAPNSDFIEPIAVGLNQLLKISLLTMQYSFFDTLLNGIDVKQMRSDAMVVILRTLFQSRREIESYAIFRDAVAIELEGRGKNVKQILRGLV